MILKSSVLFQLKNTPLNNLRLKITAEHKYDEAGPLAVEESNWMQLENNTPGTSTFRL